MATIHIQPGPELYIFSLDRILLYDSDEFWEWVKTDVAKEGPGEWGGSAQGEGFETHWDDGDDTSDVVEGSAVYQRARAARVLRYDDYGRRVNEDGEVIAVEYSPDQPRAPEGDPEGRGGQWVSADATRRERALQVFEEYVAAAPMPRRREEATALNYIQNGTGMGAPPTIVSRSELETMGMNDEVIVLYRGESDVAYIRQWQRGSLYTGEGVYGSGTYTATNIEDALAYADGDKQRIHMIGLPKSARIVDHDAILPEIRAKYHNRLEILKARQRTMESEGLSDDEINNRLMKLTQQYRDVGIYAALQGYDAIRYAPEGESGAYIVILNRSICYVVENYE